MALGRRLPLVLGALALTAAACGGAQHAGATTATPAARAATAPGAGGCTTVAKPSTKARHAAKPKQALAAGKTYDVTFKTNCGSFTVQLNQRLSPRASASVFALARAGYFDRTIFHRIVPGFIIQGGDPTATGLGGPGYTTVDRVPKATRYTHGVVAMAKSQVQPNGAAGSQFFVVTVADAQLPPQYAVIGTVTKGLAVVDRIGKLGDAQTEQPTRVVEIEKATVSTH